MQQPSEPGAAPGGVSAGPGPGATPAEAAGPLAPPAPRAGTEAPPPPTLPPPPPPPTPTAADAPAGAPAELHTRRGRIELLGRHAWALVGIGLAGVGVLYLLSQLSWLVVPALLTTIFSVVATVPVGVLEDRGLARTPAAIVVYLVIVGVFGLVLWGVGPTFVRQVGEIALDVPQVAQDLAGQLDDFQERVESASPAAANAVGQFRESVVARSESFGADLADSVFGIVGTTLGFMTASVLALILSFMIVKDLPKLTAGVRRRLARPELLRARGAAASMGRSVTGFVRGQLVVAIIVGLLETLVFWLLGLPYYVPLGVMAGIGQLVPGIGPVLAAVVPVLIALSEGGVAWALLTVAAIVVVQLAAAWWFSPRLVGTHLELPTLVVIVALLIGAVTLGLWGLVAAVPFAAAVRDGVHWAMLPEERLQDELDGMHARRTTRRRLRREDRRRARRAEATSTPEGG